MTDRGVSATLGYVLSLGIVVLLMSGLFFAAGEYVEDENQRVLRSELRVIGNQIAADISNVDQLAIVDEGSGNVTLTSDLPSHVAGESYMIGITSTGGSRHDIVLTTRQPEVSQTVSVKTNSAMVESNVSGGDITITYNGSHIEVKNA